MARATTDAREALRSGAYIGTVILHSNPTWSVMNRLFGRPMRPPIAVHYYGRRTPELDALFGSPTESRGSAAGTHKKDVKK